MIVFFSHSGHLDILQWANGWRRRSRVVRNVFMLVVMMLITSRPWHGSKPTGTGEFDRSTVQVTVHGSKVKFSSIR